GLYGVVQQHRDRHRAYAAGDGRDRRCNLLRFLKLYVAHQVVALLARRIVHAIDADVDHHRAGLHHVARDELRLADRDDENVGLARVELDAAGARVAHGDRGVAAGAVLQQQRDHGPAHDVGAADHNRVRTFWFDA